MQISAQQAVSALRAKNAPEQRVSRPAGTVEELAARYGVGQEEVRRFTEQACLAEDVARERRVRELAKRVAEGNYSVSADQVVDMAERRALADRMGDW